MMPAIWGALAMSSPVASRNVTKRIVIATKDDSALPHFEQFLAPVFHTTLLRTEEDLRHHLRNAPTHAALIDLELTDSTADGLTLVRDLRREYPDMVVAAMTRSEARTVRQRATAAGADEIFVAPVDFHALQLVVDRAIEKREAETEDRLLREQIESRNRFCDLIGGSEPMQRVYESITRVAGSVSTVLIRGESGTGKELVARAIVECSERRDRPFVAMNCAALPENLIESELFGHEKGAFTGATASRAGHIELADTGTLFLDEIATLDLALQSKLLRVLESRTVQRLGAKTAKKIDFRLITATNEDLEGKVQSGRFREDLYYRIHVVPIHLPPLRERQGDIPLLVDHFLRTYSASNRVPLKRIDPDALEILEDNPWQGNVRELENVIQRLVIMADGAVILPRHLPKQLLVASNDKQEALLIPEEGIDFDEEMTRIEQAYLKAALRRSQGSKAAAARLLHIPAQKMKYLCRKFDL